MEKVLNITSMDSLLIMPGLNAIINTCQISHKKGHSTKRFAKTSQNKSPGAKESLKNHSTLK
jgi:hypothetical protein